jgi:hypothetical protein
MVAVILCEQELKSNPQKTQYHSTQNQRERNRQNLRKEKGSGEKDISACADAAARSSGLTSTRSFFRSHLICGDAPHIRAVAPLLESYR